MGILLLCVFCVLGIGGSKQDAKIFPRMINSDTDGQSLTIGMWVEMPGKDNSGSELAVQSPYVCE